MRRVVSYGGPAGVPASQKLKHKLSLTPGLHLLSSNSVELGGFLAALGDPQDERVLHKTSWVTRNFFATSAALELAKREPWTTKRNPCPTLETGRTVFAERAEAEKQCDGGGVGLCRGYKDQEEELHRRINSGARLGKCAGEGEEVSLEVPSCRMQDVEESHMGTSVGTSTSNVTSSPSLPGEDLRHGSDIWCLATGPDEQKSSGDLFGDSTCVKQYVAEGIFGHRKTQDAEISESGGAVPHELSDEQWPFPSQFKDSIIVVGKIRGEGPYLETKALAVAVGEADIILSRTSSRIKAKLQRVINEVDILCPDIATFVMPYPRKDGVCLRISTEDVSAERVKCKQSAALEIQRYSRGCLQRSYFREMRWRLAILQSLERSVIEQHRMDSAAVLLQKHWRALESIRVVEQAVREQQRMINAATVLQKHWRAVQSRHFVNSWKMQRIAHAAIMLQRDWRAFQNRCLLEHLKIQQVVREQQRIDAAVTLQRHWRALRCRCLVEHLRMEHAVKNQQRIDNAVIVQKHWRGFQSRSLAKLLKLEQIEWERQSFNNGAVVLQRQRSAAQSRRVLEHTEKDEVLSEQQKIDDAAIIVQKRWRGLQCRLMLKKINAQRERAAVCIHAHGRGNASRVKLRTQESAALLIQRAWNRYWSSRRTLSHVSIQQACHSYSNQNGETQGVLVLNDSSLLSHGSTGALIDGVPAGNNREMGCLSELDLVTCDASGYLSTLAQVVPKVSRVMGETHQSKTIQQNEKRLQQFAQVFLLQRHITLQQQRAQAAPPFPPIVPSGSGLPSSLASQSLEIESSNLSFTDARTAVLVQNKPGDISSRWVAVNQNLVRETMNSGDQPTLKEQPPCKQDGVSTKQVVERPGRDVILDVVLLLRQMEEYGTARTAFEGESRTCAPRYSDIEEGAPLLGCNMGSIQMQSCVAKSISIKRIGKGDVNAVLLVLIAMVVYTRTICRGVFYRSRQTDRKV